MIDDHIIPECYLDTNLVETLVYPSKKGYNHQKGCGAVAKEMREKFNDDFAVGIIDKDKELVDYVLGFNLLDRKYDIELYKHPSKNHYMIIHPPLEQWLITECQQVNLNIMTYVKYSGGVKDLKRITGKSTIKDDSNFKRMFKDLKHHQATGIIQLQKWIEYLKNNFYTAKEDELKLL
jgi:hypothetical protein